MPSPLLIRNGLILTFGEDVTAALGWILIHERQICATGIGDPPPLAAPNSAEVIDATGMAVLPGLINAHTHLSQTFARGTGDGYVLSEWLRTVSHPLRAAISVHEVELATLLGIVGNIRAGSTALIDHVKVTISEHVEAGIRAASHAGIRMMLARAWRDQGTDSESLASIIETMRELVERWHLSSDGIVTLAFGPSAQSRCSAQSLRKTAEKAIEWSIPIHMHVAETRDEVRASQEETGMSPIEWLHSLGVLGKNFHAVHCVWASDADLDLLAASNALIVHCPVSNMYLASGIAPLRNMLERGIRVALGTDGAASNNSQDLFETGKLAALAAKVSTGDAAAVTAADILRMLVCAGGSAFGTQFGTIGPHAPADLTIVNLNTSRCVPNHRIDSTLVYSAGASDVDTVIVNGRVLMRHGVLQTMDEAGLLRECRDAAAGFARRAGLLK